MKKQMTRALLILLIASMVGGCMARPTPLSSSVPAAEYADGIRAQLGIPYQDSVVGERAFRRDGHSGNEADARVHFAKQMPHEFSHYGAAGAETFSNMGPKGINPGHMPEYMEAPSATRDMRPYRSPLAPGNPGVDASLYRESRMHNNLFRDHRAFQPMDLVTIRISERVDASTEADTEVSQNSNFLAGIAGFFNVESTIQRKNSGLDMAELVNAASSSNFTGEGDTSRKGQFNASMSAMVVEVLPSGVIRIEGKRIVTVNNEEQTLLVTGLVRPRDINSQNEVDSNKIANLRVDLFGHGSVGSAQTGGWLGNTLRRYWPF